jgi:response regulator RpfG family c-di-GMP phosphodiesterase
VDDEELVCQSLVRMLGALGLSAIGASTGAEALALLGRHPELVLCIVDINMPIMGGVELLEHSRAQYPDVGVVMLTGVADVEVAMHCLRCGALDYLTKPATLDEIRLRVTGALERRAQELEARQVQARLRERVRELGRRQREAVNDGVTMLAHALEARDSYVSGHSRRVERLAARIAVHLGYTGDPLAAVELGARLHDVGTIGIRDELLVKPGPLAPDELEHVQSHTLLGERILRPFLLGEPTVLQVVRSHHERMDGSGFPDGLSGESIPLAARIVAVADAYDAMTTNHAYRSPCSGEEAIAMLRNGVGKQFDPQVISAFEASL